MKPAARPSVAQANPDDALDDTLCDPQERLVIEAQNSLRQFDEVRRLAAEHAGAFKLTPTLICDLQRLSMEGIFACAGKYRNHPIHIRNTLHSPPDHTRVNWLVQEMCDYANGASGRSPIHTASFILWRLNWIHPFRDGNGRTSRVVSYYALCVRLGFVPPGTPTIPELIAFDRNPYYAALDVADAEYKASGEKDLACVGAMELYLELFLTKQLASVIKTAKAPVA